MATTARDKNISTIEDLYGCPGSNHDTEAGDVLLLQLFEEHGGLSLLTDDALSMLAKLHRQEDERRAGSYERRA